MSEIVLRFHKEKLFFLFYYLSCRDTRILDVYKIEIAV